MLKVPEICVVIAARNAERTIGRAVRSALSQSRKTEVIVVDDASTDRTGDVASIAAAGSVHFRLISLARNVGPAAARNLAFEQTCTPYIAVLDADDILLPNRFDNLLALQDWDLAADNIAFVSEPSLPELPELSQPNKPWQARLNFRDFVLANMSDARGRRRQLGFLKPIFKTVFLRQHNLKYNESLRLGEDFILYARILALGGRFKITSTCGYVAIERANSLSSLHSEGDLKALYQADLRLLAELDLTGPERQALLRHSVDIRHKARLRGFLARKKSHGVAEALAELAQSPSDLWPVCLGVVRDKSASFRERHVKLKSIGTKIHFLLPDQHLGDQIHF